MNIRFERKGGGVVYHQIKTDGSKLSAAEMSDVEKMVDEAAFFDLPGEMPAPDPRANGYHYMVAVENEGKEHTVKVSEAAIPEKLQPLIDMLSQAAMRRP